MNNNFFFFLRNKKNIKNHESESEHDIIRQLKNEMKNKSNKKKQKTERKSALFINSNNALNNFCKDKLENQVKRKAIKLPCIGDYIDKKVIKSFFFSSGFLKFSNGMMKSEWMHCTSLCKKYEKDFKRKESEMMNELIERKTTRRVLKKNT